MQMFFIDESGTPPKPTASPSHPHFVIAGVVIPSDKWKSLSDELMNLKQSTPYRVQGEIKWRHFGERNTEKINNVTHLTTQQKFDFRRDMFGIITKTDYCKIMGCVSHAPSAYKTSYVTNEEDLYEYTYKPVTERFQYYLQGLSSLSGNNMGIIISDHRGRKQDELLRRHHQKLIFASAAAISTYSNLIETLFLTPSHQSVGIQFADMIAGAIARAYNANDPTFAKMLKPAFRKGPGDKIPGFGLVSFPKTSWKGGAG
jgi:Protein of unknown function (DUF3800)